MSRPELSFQRDYEPVPSMAGPMHPRQSRPDYKPCLAMQEAIRRSERHPKLLSMTSKANTIKGRK